MTHEAIVERADALLRRHGVSVNGQTVVVGCSGGADSSVLLHVLVTLGANPCVVHVNYGLRGADSDADEAFVVAMCREFDLEPEIVRVTGQAIRGGTTTSVQDAARRIRYGAFHSHAQTVGARFVAVAHTLNDQSETVLLHLLRGTGVDGLAGMRVSRAFEEGSGIRLIRPLLTTSRNEVEAVASELGAGWRHDSSNMSPTYARGRLRTQVVPTIEEAFGAPQWLNVGRVALRVAGYVDEYLSPELEARFARVADSEARRLSVDLLLTEPPAWRGRILLEAVRRWAPSMSASEAWLARLEDLAGMQPGRRVEAGGAVVVRDRDHLTFLTHLAAPEATILEVGASAAVGPHRIHLYELAERPAVLDQSSVDVAFVHARALAHPITVRVWEAGDRMTPLGLKNSKLVSDILTDRKVPPSRRSLVPVVRSGDEVVWCAGVAIADQFKVTDESGRCLILIRTDTSNPSVTTR